MTDTIMYIRNHLTEAEQWGQLAEECTELAQACLKMQRLYLENNPPRKSVEECIDAVTEEHADVCGCFAVLGWSDKWLREEIMETKLNRWASIIAQHIAEKEAIG